MTKANIVKPKLTVLDSEQIQQVHDYSLQILSTTGVRVDSEKARQLFARAIGAQPGDDNRVRIPDQLVEWALQAAPSTIDIYDRNGTFVFRLPDRVRFGIGVTDLYFQDPQTDQVIPFGREHTRASVRLGDRLSSFDVISTIGILQDVPPQASDLYASLEMTANTVKPLIILISDERVFPVVLDLLEHLHGDLARRPSIIPYFNPITPLVMNAATVDKMMITIDRGLPFIYSNYVMAGASAPITPAGALALINAELLAGLTLSQLIKEGTAVILGSLPTYFDMKEMASFRDPKSYLINLACAEMMAHYQLPHAGASGSGQGWGADLILAGHQWQNHLISCMGKVGLAPFVGDILGSLVFSPNVIVFADEIIQQARLYAEGFVLDDAVVALDEIAEVGPGRHFLDTNLTFDNFRTAYFNSDIFDKMTLNKWQEKGCPRADDLLRNYTLDLMADCKPPVYFADLREKGEAFIKKHLNNSPKVSKTGKTF
jgi:trimethylamine--corrinoid protein Co-methyltransferase